MDNCPVNEYSRFRFPAELLDDRDWHPRELSRVLGLTNSAVAGELQKLCLHGIARSRRVGNQTRYSANPECPVYAELRGLLVKTAGVAGRLRAALSSMPDAARIDEAYIFGSFADGSQRADSDVDVLIVGQLDSNAVIDALGPVEDELRREVNVVVYAPEQYRQELAADAGFIHRVHHGHRIMLMGKQDA